MTEEKIQALIQAITDRILYAFKTLRGFHRVDVDTDLELVVQQATRKIVDEEVRKAVK